MTDVFVKIIRGVYIYMRKNRNTRKGFHIQGMNTMNNKT